MCYPLDREIQLILDGEVIKTSGKGVFDFFQRRNTQPGSLIPVLGEDGQVRECIRFLAQGCSWLPVELTAVDDVDEALYLSAMTRMVG